MKEPEFGSLVGFLFLLALSSFIFGYAWQKGFFKLPAKKIEKKLTWVHLVAVLASTVALLIIVMPLVIIPLSKKLGLIAENIGFSPQNIGLLIIALWIIFYLFLISKDVSTYILFRHQKPTFLNQAKSAGSGIVAFLIAYPASLVVTLIISWITWKIFGAHGVDQVAVDHLKNTAKNFKQYLSTVLLISLVVPFLEEFFFRGLLQNWLKKFMPQMSAIFLTSAIFAIVHFATKQGIGNIELIGTLFFLACFLGFIYEKTGQLISSVAFHGAYNALNSILVYIEVMRNVQ